MNARARGAQPRNANARKHGAYSHETQKATSIADLVEALIHRQEEILMYAQQAAEKGDIDTAVKAMGIYGANASRLARMLQRATGELSSKDIEATLRDALDEAQKGLDEELKREAEK